MKSKEIMAFAATWRDLEMLTQSEGQSDSETPMPPAVAHRWKLKQGHKDVSAEEILTHGL